MKRTLLVILCTLIILPLSAQADLYMRTKITTSGLAGLGGTKGTSETWLSGKKQVEITKIEVTSPLMKPFMDGSVSHTITDLERGVITEVNEKEKNYREISFEEMQAQLKAAQQKAQEAYGEAKEVMEKPMPRVQGGEIHMETKATGETKKFAGFKAERTTLTMRSTGIDEESGENVTLKIVYDAWLTPKVPGGAEREAFAKAYAEAFQLNLEDQLFEEDASLATAFASAGLTPDALAPQLENLKGYPVKFTVRIGSELTDKQRKELQDAMKEEKQDEGGGGLSLGGFGKKLKKAVGDKISGAIVDQFFGEGVRMDKDGDPIFFSMTSELEKVGSKTKESRYVVPDGFKKLEP